MGSRRYGVERVIVASGRSEPGRDLLPPPELSIEDGYVQVAVYEDGYSLVRPVSLHAFLRLPIELTRGVVWGDLSLGRRHVVLFVLVQGFPHRALGCLRLAQGGEAMVCQDVSLVSGVDTEIVIPRLIGAVFSWLEFPLPTAHEVGDLVSHDALRGLDVPVLAPDDVDRPSGWSEKTYRAWALAVEAAEHFEEDESEKWYRTDEADLAVLREADSVLERLEVRVQGRDWNKISVNEWVQLVPLQTPDSEEIFQVKLDHDEKLVRFSILLNQNEVKGEGLTPWQAVEDTGWYMLESRWPSWYDRRVPENKRPVGTIPGEETYRLLGEAIPALWSIHQLLVYLESQAT